MGNYHRYPLKLYGSGGGGGGGGGGKQYRTDDES